MNISIGYRFIENFIIIEFLLVALIILLTLYLKAYSSLKNKRRTKIKNNLINYLKNVISKKETFDTLSLPKKWKRLDILLEVVQNFDERGMNHWQHYRTKFIVEVLLPLAKKMAYSRHWDSRYYAARAFGLIEYKGIDSIINDLINDKIPLVYLYAWKAALINQSDLAIDSMIKKMAAESWASQSIELSELTDYPSLARSIFEKKLTTLDEPDFRTICYKILLRFPAAKITWDISRDLNSSNLQLKITSIKFISYADPSAAIPILIAALKDERVSVKVVSLRRLNWLKAKIAIPHIMPLLNDPDWWVRISAAEALKNIGDEGEKAYEVDKLSFNVDPILNKWY